MKLFEILFTADDGYQHLVIIKATDQDDACVTAEAELGVIIETITEIKEIVDIPDLDFRPRTLN